MHTVDFPLATSFGVMFHCLLSQSHVSNSVLLIDLRCTRRKDDLPRFRHDIGKGEKEHRSDF